MLVTCGCPLSISRGPNPLASRLRGATESCAIYMALYSDRGSDMSAILVRAKIATEIKTLSTREQWPDSAISQLTILLVRVL